MEAIELQIRRDARAWVRLGLVTEDDQPGTVSSDAATGRQLFLFGWLDGQPGVYESVGGVDVESEEHRSVHSAGFRRLTDLGDAFELTILRDGEPRYLRFELRRDLP